MAINFSSHFGFCTGGFLKNFYFLVVETGGLNIIMYLRCQCDNINRCLSTYGFGCQRGDAGKKIKNETIVLFSTTGAFLENVFRVIGVFCKCFMLKHAVLSV